MGEEEIQEQQIADKVRDAIAEIVRGTPWAPPEGGVLTDILVVFQHMSPDSEYGTTWMCAGPVTNAEGMARYVLRTMDRVDQLKVFEMAFGDDGSD